MILKIYENKSLSTIFGLETSRVICYSCYIKNIIEYAKMERIPDKEDQKTFEYVLSTNKFEIFTYEFENVDELTKKFVQELI